MSYFIKYTCTVQDCSTTSVSAAATDTAGDATTFTTEKKRMNKAKYGSIHKLLLMPVIIISHNLHQKTTTMDTIDSSFTLQILQ